MAYFLKKSRNKKGLYLQIYESFWDPQRGHTAATSTSSGSPGSRTRSRTSGPRWRR